MGDLAYTTGMSFFVSATPPPKAKTNRIQALSLTLAVVFIGMAVAQLFTYEKFPDTIAGLWLPGGAAFAHLLAALIVIFEVLALPYLLFMRLSPLMRAVSMVAGWLVIGAWLAITVWENLTTNAVGNSGLLGETVSLPVGWWSMLFVLALGILVVWVNWGMWPFTPSKKK